MRWRCLGAALSMVGWLAVGLSAAPQAGSAPLPVPIVMSDAQLQWIAEQVFRNECAARRECLVHWNQGEAFPSLGIGHFIWYPAGTGGRFVESFPALLTFMQARGVLLPPPLSRAQSQGAPWRDREAFLAVQASPDVEAIRAFLASTQSLQAEFILQRAQASLQHVVGAAPADRKDQVARALNALLATPGGAYALIDYVNFKGEGLAATETYQGQGWGLLQVLLDMRDQTGQSALERFRDAAGRILTRRAQLADNPLERERWLPGWLKRLDSYREPE